MSKHTPGPWIVATSCSWRRIVALHSTESVCEPIKQNDGHPDLYFRNGGANGPDARLIASAPDLLAALQGLVSCINETRGPNAHAALESARAAIAKATPKAGESKGQTNDE